MHENTTTYLRNFTMSKIQPTLRSRAVVAKEVMHSQLDMFSREVPQRTKTLLKSRSESTFKQLNTSFYGDDTKSRAFSRHIHSRLLDPTIKEAAGAVKQTNFEFIEAKSKTIDGRPLLRKPPRHAKPPRNIISMD